jgi:hypothetical protein
MPTADPFAPLDDNVSPVAKELARRYAPRLRDELESRKADIIKASGGFLTQRAVAAAWPIGLRLIPHATESGVAAMLDEFGGMTLAEVASKLLAHNAARGVASHPSLYHH